MSAATNRLLHQTRPKSKQFTPTWRCARASRWSAYSDSRRTSLKYNQVVRQQDLQARMVGARRLFLAPSRAERYELPEEPLLRSGVS